jgi:hypothetical protein
LTEAQLKAGESALNVKQATAELSEAVANGTVNVAQAKDMLSTWVEQGLISAGTAAALGAQFDDTASRARKLGETDPNVKVSESGSARVQGTLTATQQKAINLGRQRPNVVATATDQATPTFNIVRAAADLLDGKTATVYINVSGAAAAANALARAGRQHGGPVRAGEAYVVGEAGPELLIMGDKSGQIIPNGALTRPAGGGWSGTGGGTAIHNHFHIAGSVLSEGDLIRTVNKAMANGRVHKRGRVL